MIKDTIKTPHEDTTQNETYNEQNRTLNPAMEQLCNSDAF